jgi:hypothetical protein
VLGAFVPVFVTLNIVVTLVILRFVLGVVDLLKVSSFACTLLKFALAGEGLAQMNWKALLSLNWKSGIVHLQLFDLK